MRLAALLAVVPYLVFGGSLQEALLGSLRSHQQQEVMQCNVCPFNGSAVIPSDTPRTVPGCCSGNFQECGVGSARCRLLGQYTIPLSEAPSGNVDICPSVPEPGCNCQLALSTSLNVSMKLCPSPKQCCQNCRCIGDPHCVSFNGTPKSFVVCDVRDGNCEFPSSRSSELQQRCRNETFDGMQCVVRPDVTGKLFCQIPPGVPEPTMMMYNRTYVNDAGETREFSIILQLSIYGSVDRIWIKDGLNTYVFGIQFKNRKFSCTLPPNLAQISTHPSLNAGGYLALDKLDSGVLINLKCIIKGSEWGTRWEVPKLADDYIPNAPNRGGFCQTGQIPESSGESTPCVIDRRLLSQFEVWGYRCKQSTTFITPSPTTPSDNSSDTSGWSPTYCKRNWCNKALINTGKSKNWIAAGFSSVQQCEAYVSKQGDFFLTAVCAVAPGVTSTPANCAQDENCKNCMDTLKDYPDEAVDVLQPNTVPRPLGGGSSSGGGGSGGGGSCDLGSLLEQGLENVQNNASLASGGIKILFQSALGGPFEVIWMATDAQIQTFTSRCGCVDFLQQTQDVLFTAAGTYQVQQCFPENQFITNNCQSSPTYLLEVDYPTTPLQADFSFPFGDLVDSGQLVCSQDMQCPPNSQCCLWTNGGPGWKDCLGSLASQYPNCGKKSGCPGCP